MDAEFQMIKIYKLSDKPMEPVVQVDDARGEHGLTTVSIPCDGKFKIKFFDYAMTEQQALSYLRLKAFW